MLTNDILKQLIDPGPRLPWVIRWLLDNVWSCRRFEATDPETYLTDGERMVHAFEDLIASSADQLYDELTSAALQSPQIWERDPVNSAIVVFDGASLREIPLFLQKSRESGFRVIECSTSMAALPSTTTAFVAARLIGKEVAPKLLPQRREIKEKGAEVYYFDDAISTRQIYPVDKGRLLVWSAFPDNTYQDSDARFARHFTDMQTLFDTAWKNTVMQIPRGRRIAITSDHGYIFFGAGCDSTSAEEAAELLNHDRFRVFGDNEGLPSLRTPGLQIVPEKRLAMLRGRIKNRPKGPSANKVYRHGGLSLMEMITPWIVIEKEDAP